MPYNIIPESDVYLLIMRSRLPGAIRFQKWVCEEVLPSIRKHGGYLTPDKIDEILDDPDTIIKLATNLKNERNKQLALAETNSDNVRTIYYDSD